MNIVLTQKDADLIISYLREEVENIIAYQNDAEGELESFYKDCEQMSDSEKAKTFKELLDGAKLLFDEKMKNLDSERNKIISFISLLTTGSEGLNGAA